MKPTVTWVLIADGAQARVLRHDGPGKGFAPVKGLSFEQAHLQAQDIMADRPGRAFSSVGSGRSGYEPQTDPVDDREARFVENVADTLAKHHAAGEFDRLIIAADPTSLGNIRARLGKAVSQAVMAEIPKDLTNVPAPKLPAHFEGILAV